MSDNTGIEWTDATWNPVTGCTKISSGCDHCYAETFAERWRGTSGHYFEGGFDVQLRPDKLTLPLRWKRSRRIFVNSMSDLFHNDVPDEYIAKVFAVMAATPDHTFQVLTKRHGRMRSLLSRGTLGTAGFADDVEEAMAEFTHARLDIWPLPNVWLGVSVEDREWAARRIPMLRSTPAAVRWISAEPLLGPLELAAHFTSVCPFCGGTGLLPGRNFSSGQKVGPPACYHCNSSGEMPGLDWVVVGGESGRGARPMNPEWATSIRDQCKYAGVPFLFKQWGGRTPKANGRELDGRTWDEYPERAA